MAARAPLAMTSAGGVFGAYACGVLTSSGVSCTRLKYTS